MQPFLIVLKKIAKSSHAFARSTRGVAVIEFSFIAPIMIFLVFALFEYNFTLQYERHITRASRLMAEMAAAEVQLSGTLDDQPVIDAVNAAWMVNIPEIANEPEYDSGRRGTDLSIQATRFTPSNSTCTTSCTFTGKHQWDYSIQSFTNLPSNASSGLGCQAQDQIYTIAPMQVISANTPWYPAIYGQMNSNVAKFEDIIQTEVTGNTQWFTFIGTKALFKILPKVIGYKTIRRQGLSHPALSAIITPQVNTSFPQCS